MVTAKQINQRFKERTSKEIGVKTSDNGVYTNKPKSDIYSIGQAYGGYRVERQLKGRSGSSNVSDRYSAKEMEVFLKGMEAGARIKGKKDIPNV